jgi:hypothetical protein
MIEEEDEFDMRSREGNSQKRKQSAINNFAADVEQDI